MTSWIFRPKLYTVVVYDSLHGVNKTFAKAPIIKS